ncbi:hypothetical protein [Bifidobacterium miconisargentati]|uniref:hypothetical protein n=1 Tax=Bifidobacterium miconisargentati TaxID=2834437 RepID=UPI001BDCF7D1|nr:hypothetical protein [Bifidobacterium miconisargentati]MBW3089247.1 hypothetical protein [Bifidobacterium miconisargentati]
MRNANFKPSASTRGVKRPEDVFRQEAPISEEWVNTSVRLRVNTRNRVKLYAAGHGLKIQDVIETALLEHLERIGG